MSDTEEDIFGTSGAVPDATTLVSKWLEESDDDENDHVVATKPSTAILSRVDGYVKESKLDWD